jgi:hypothetical protein
MPEILRQGPPGWPRFNPYAGAGNRPPFRARLVGKHCGHVVELIPVLTLYNAEHPQHWQCWVPPDAELCLPFETHIDPLPGEERDLRVSVAVTYGKHGEVYAYPPDARLFTPN